MADIGLTVYSRETSGKEAAHKLRAKGLIPAIVYGKGKKNTLVSVNPSTLKKALEKGGGINTLIHLEIEGEKSTLKRVVIVKEIQKDPINNAYGHVDFYELELTKKVMVNVPLHFVGKAEGIAHGGIVEPLLREVKVKCLPNKIPSHIEVDVTSLNIGATLRMSDLKSTQDFEILFEQDDAIVKVAIPKEEAPAAPPAAAEAAAVSAETPSPAEKAKTGEKAESEAGSAAQAPAEGKEKK